eukprot:1569218-Rhodomonas_salina.1
MCCGRYDYIWNPLEQVCIAFFSFEFCARFLACPLHYGLTGKAAVRVQVPFPYPLLSLRIPYPIQSYPIPAYTPLMPCPVLMPSNPIPALTVFGTAGRKNAIVVPHVEYFGSAG